MPESSTNRPLFSALGLVIIGVLLFAILALSNTALRGARLDLTENRLYTLAPGTRAILAEIDEPINLYFFYSKKTGQGFPTVSTYAQRVQEMLQEMTQVADGKIKLSIVDPEPFSEQEDRAVQLGVQRIPLGSTGDTLYFGLAGTNALGETESIAYFSQDRESLLEYDIAKLVYQLARDEKPIVGLLSGLEMGGGFDPASMRAQPAWVVLEQLRQFFEVRTLDVDLDAIPDEIGLLVLVHPTDLKPTTQYAIDQFVLGGGHALVFVDPYADSVAATAGMMGAPQSTESDLPKLLPAWGAKLRGGEVLGDGLYALQVSVDPARAPVRDYGTVGIRSSSMNEDDIVTGGLEQINFAYAGILEPAEETAIEFTPLITSSNQSMPISGFQIRPGMDPVDLQRNFKPTGEIYTIAVRLNGKAKTAFPHGPPPKTQDPPAEESGEAPADNVRPEDPQRPHLSESVDPINVVVVADTDLLTDRLWVRIESFFGQRIASPFASNGDLAVNAVDNLLGSSDLISIRARASFSRPFNRVEALRIEAEGRLRAEEQQLRTRLRETESKIAELQTQEGKQDSLILTSEQRQAITGFERELIETRKALRAVQHELNKNIERLGGILKFVNIVLIPLLLTIGLAIFVWKRQRRQTEGHPGGKV